MACIGTLVAFAAIAAGCSSSNPSNPSNPTSTPAADVTVNITGINGSNSFAPSPTTVSVGQRVVWKNVDGITHNIIQDNGGFTTPNISGGSAAGAVTMSTPGTFTYHCGIHPSMVGTITVQ